MSKNYWPMGIFLFSLVVVGMIILTIKTAINNPVEIQRMCGFTSQYVDENINEITIKRNEFLEKYNISFEGSRDVDFKSFTTTFVRIKDKVTNKIITDAEIKFYLTRPNTTRNDMELGVGELVDGLYQSPRFKVDIAGRWQMDALVRINDDYICISENYNVSKVEF
ncbi:FixH family protein [Helicobacter ibis]|uniref:FixH family protein n=1 Tax=Helicobacter ibis TaxID=2962633 RepID=A0ABT4VCE0_9HELI|nr:FixH family protein [Helicobacter ibis]MDA3968369.1 FixH family protein [Helicobacter ibis]